MNCRTIFSVTISSVSGTIDHLRGAQIRRQMQIEYLGRSVVQKSGNTPARMTVVGAVENHEKGDYFLCKSHLCSSPLGDSFSPHERLLFLTHCSLSASPIFSPVMYLFVFVLVVSFFLLNPPKIKGVLRLHM